jgi:hypothetical protein
MQIGEQLILRAILEENGFIVCELHEDIDPSIATVKVWHKPMDAVEVLEWSMNFAEKRKHGNK